MTHWTKENQIDAPYTHAFLNKGTLNMKGFLCGTVVKNPPISAAYARDVSSIPGSGRHPGVGNGNPLQYLAWKTPRTEEPGRLQSMGSQRVGHDLVMNNNNKRERKQNLTSNSNYRWNRVFLF